MKGMPGKLRAASMHQCLVAVVAGYATVRKYSIELRLLEGHHGKAAPESTARMSHSTPSRASALAHQLHISSLIVFQVKQSQLHARMPSYGG